MDFPVVVVIIGTLLCHDTFETLQQLHRTVLQPIHFCLKEKYQYFRAYI